MWEFPFRIFIHHFFFLLHFKLQNQLVCKTRQFFWFTSPPSLLQEVDSIVDVSLVFSVSVAVPNPEPCMFCMDILKFHFILRVWFYLGTVWCNVHFSYTIVEHYILVRKYSCSSIFIFIIIARLVTGMLLYLIFIGFWVKPMFWQYIGCCYNVL